MMPHRRQETLDGRIPVRDASANAAREVPHGKPQRPD
jgi:hypothetical protein